MKILTRLRTVLVILLVSAVGHMFVSFEIRAELVTVEQDGHKVPTPLEDPPNPEESKQEAGKQEAMRELKPDGPLSFLSKRDYTFIPLPAFAYARNEGYWIGALMPTLKGSDKGEVENIIAPQYLHNENIGENLTLNYYGYRNNGMVQYRAVASYATKIERYFDLSYMDLAAGGGRYILGGQISWFKNPFARFFGFSNGSSEADETNYTSREGLVNFTLGVNLTADALIMFTERYRDVRIEQGAVDSLPQTKQLFPDVTGIGGAHILGHRLTFRYDTRDFQLTPSSGTYVNVFAEFDQNLMGSGPNRWWRYSFDARHLIRHNTDQVFVMHVLFDAVTGDRIPFYERPSLGGENTLRGFGLMRFIDDTAVLINLENRIQALERQIFDYNINLEIAPFLDIGRVGSNFETDWLNQIEYNPGLGFRVTAKPHVVGRIDVAYGRDGANTFVGLDYPF